MISSKTKPNTNKGQQKPQQPTQQKGKTPQTQTQPKGKTPVKTEPKPQKQPTKTDKKEDTGIDFKDELGNKGKKTNPKKTPTAKQDSTKTPAKPKRKEIDPDDEYYDLEGF